MKLLREAHCERIAGGTPVGNINVSPVANIDPVDVITEVKPKVVAKTSLIGGFDAAACMMRPVGHGSKRCWRRGHSSPD